MQPNLKCYATEYRLAVKKHYTISGGYIRRWPYSVHLFQLLGNKTTIILVGLVR